MKPHPFIKLRRGPRLFLDITVVFPGKIISVTQNMKMDEKSAHNVIDDDVCAFLPYNLISTPYTSSYHFSSYLHIIFSKAVGALRYSSSFSIQNAKCIFDVVHPFHVLWDGPFLHGQTVAISKSPYYIWKRYNKT